MTKQQGSKLATTSGPDGPDMPEVLASLSSALASARRTRRSSWRTYRAVGMIAVVGLSGGSAALAATGVWSLSDVGIVAKSGPGVVLRPDLAGSAELQQTVIANVSLLRSRATAVDTIPTRYRVGKGDPNSALASEDNLALARRIPGRSGALWVMPLKTGGLAIIAPTGGAEYTAEQLAAGTIVWQGRPDAHNAISLTGVVPDGVRSVSVADGNGASKSATVDHNTYSATVSTAGDDLPQVSVVAEDGKTTTATLGTGPLR